MEPDGDSPPNWSTPSTLYVPVRRRRRLYSVLIPVIAFSVILIFIGFLLLPATRSRNDQVLKPKSSTKKSWNSINIFLVLFAVLCGVARRNDETPSSDATEAVPNAYESVTSGSRSVPGADWLDSPDRTAYDKMSDYMNIGGKTLRRSSSSYPDLRQESLWRSDVGKFKSFDDFEVDFHRWPGNLHPHVRQSYKVEKDVVAETPVTEIPVDKFELKNSVPPPSTKPISQPPPPPPPPPPLVKRRRSVHSVPKQYNVEMGGREAEFNEKRSSVPPPSKTPPPPDLKFHPLAERREKIQMKKSVITKEIATAILSVLYQGTEGKRNKKVKSRVIFESVAQNSSPPTELAPPSIPSVPPPPPPPPPSKKVLQNFFKKSSKSKRVHSVSTANPPPPPPPPPNSIFNNIFKTGNKSKRFQSTSASSHPPPPPPPPPTSSMFNSLFKNGTKSRRLKSIDPQLPPAIPPTPRNRPKQSPASTGKPPKPTKPSTPPHESVFIAPASPVIPRPPPPPPFSIPEMKLLAKGDFVRIRSANSSWCSYPRVEDFDVMSVKSDGEDSIGSSFTCPSPDVDLKADTFISKRRDEWRLEKMNSLKERLNTGSSSARLL